MISIKKKITPAQAQQDNSPARFQDGFFSALSGVDKFRGIIALKLPPVQSETADLLAAEKFNAAFIGLSLPSIDGREMCRQIKKAQPECLTVLIINREGEEKSEGVDYIALRPLEEEKVRSYIEK